MLWVTGLCVANRLSCREGTAPTLCKLAMERVMHHKSSLSKREPKRRERLYKGMTLQRRSRALSIVVRANPRKGSTHSPVGRYRSRVISLINTTGTEEQLWHKVSWANILEVPTRGGCFRLALDSAREQHTAWLNSLLSRRKQHRKEISECF